MLGRQTGQTRKPKTQKVIYANDWLKCQIMLGKQSCDELVSHPGGWMEGWWNRNILSFMLLKPGKAPRGYSGFMQMAHKKIP